ncbi:hypothetical protein LTR08_003750 [Meristemomyces frigidus]|nr:hypothetical protein LTR08_003750 [Meristemomyces frigidus]
MAFLYQITTGVGGEPVLNFANQQNNCTLFNGTELVNCPDIGNDITLCQQKYGKTILLSVGGATYTEAGFTSEDAATAAAEKLWAMFGPQQHGSSVLRPFGDAIIDGFDFDFETTVTNTVPFANQLRSLMDADPTRTYYLTAAPQCPFPDLADDPMLSGNVSFDAVFVQSYNNYCGLNAFVHGAAEQTTFNFAAWDKWAKTVSLNPNVKVFLGVPAGSTAAGSGYTSVVGLTPIVEYCNTFSSFGGVMAWDFSQAYGSQKAILRRVKSALTASRRSGGV